MVMIKKASIIISTRNYAKQTFTFLQIVETLLQAPQLTKENKKPQASNKQFNFL